MPVGCSRDRWTKRIVGVSVVAMIGGIGLGIASRGSGESSWARGAILLVTLAIAGFSLSIFIRGRFPADEDGSPGAAIRDVRFWILQALLIALAAMFALGSLALPDIAVD